MLPGMELMGCTDLAVPAEVMQHVVRVESSFNPYAIGVVGGRLARQPQNLPEALSTARMLERNGYNFSLGLAQVNRHNLDRHGLGDYAKAFEVCPNLQAGSRILAECYGRSGNDWGKALSCYYSGNFETGFRHGYVQKVLTSWRGAALASQAAPIEVVGRQPSRGRAAAASVAADMASLVTRRVFEANGPVPAQRVQALAPAAAAVAVQPQAAAQQPIEAMPMRAQPVPASPQPAAPPPVQALAVDDAAPVTVQLIGTPQRQAAAPTDARQAAPAPPAAAMRPARDEAFVF